MHAASPHDATRLPRIDTFAQLADGRVDQDQEPEHGGLPAGLAFPGVRISLVGELSLLALSERH